MSSGAAIEMYWDDEAEALKPVPGWVGRCRKRFVPGEVYHIVEQEPRSIASHNHYFAAVEQAWKNLPEILAERFPTADHLRKYSLIKTGWHNSQSIAAGSHAAALKLASFIEAQDDFALAIVEDTVVTAFRAKTQSFRMGKDDFQRSKEDVLGFLSNLIGVTPKQLAHEGARS